MNACASVVVVVFVACTLIAAQPRVGNPPGWSWNTLGNMAFIHGGKAPGYNSSDLAFLIRFPMVQFDKMQNTESMPNAAEEDRFIAGARQVKAAAAAAGKHVKILMYMNGLINDPRFQRTYNATVKDNSLLLRNSKGKLVTLTTPDGVYDMRNPKMRQIFIDGALYGMASKAFDGIFVDRANWAEKCTSGRGWDNETCSSIVPAQRLLLSELYDVLGENNITLAKETGDAPMKDWQVVNAAMTSDTFCSMYCHQCASNTTPASLWTSADAQACADSIATIANMSARGQLTQSHGMGPMTTNETLDEEGRLFTMAAFLIGAGNLSYYSYADWAGDSWGIGGTRWWPEYDKKIGTPITPANTKIPGKRWKYMRKFSSGTSVYIDVATRVVNITWAE
eukprot:m.13040 g.13040  ORF g.13040 m.13040 type:complete len:394 (+) comp4777_c0_seq1:241-1422(+)